MDGDNDALIASRAEEVRAYLVALRGGAPFLSGPDGRILVAWLEQGIPVARITAAIDSVAERRRQKRVKSRMTLWACRTELGRVLDPPPAPALEERAVEERGLAGWIAELARAPVSPSADVAHPRLVADLRSIGDAPTEIRADGAIRAVRRFHEAVWEGLGTERRVFEDAALRELGALVDGMDEVKRQGIVEEVARDLLRSRFPLVSAKVVWDRLREELG